MINRIWTPDAFFRNGKKSGMDQTNFDFEF